MLERLLLHLHQWTLLVAVLRPNIKPKWAFQPPSAFSGSTFHAPFAVWWKKGGLRLNSNASMAIANASVCTCSLRRVRRKSSASVGTPKHHHEHDEWPREGAGPG